MKNLFYEVKGYVALLAACVISLSAIGQSYTIPNDTYGISYEFDEEGDAHIIINGYKGNEEALVFEGKIQIEGHDADVTDIYSFSPTSGDDNTTLKSIKITDIPTLSIVNPECFTSLKSFNTLDLYDITSSEQVSLFMACTYPNPTTVIVSKDVKKSLSATIPENVTVVTYRVYENIRYEGSTIVGFEEGKESVVIPDYGPDNVRFFSSIAIDDENNGSPNIQQIEIQAAHIKSISLGSASVQKVIFANADSYVECFDSEALNGVEVVFEDVFTEDGIVYGALAGGGYGIIGAKSTAVENGVLQLNTYSNVDSKYIPRILKMSIEGTVNKVVVNNTNEYENDTINVKAFDALGENAVVVINGSNHDLQYVRLSSIHDYESACKYYVDTAALKRMHGELRDADFWGLNITDLKLHKENFDGYSVEGDALGVTISGYSGNSTALEVPSSFTCDGVTYPVIGITSLGSSEKVTSVSFASNTNMQSGFSVGPNLFDALPYLEYVDFRNVAVSVFSTVFKNNMDYILISAKDYNNELGYEVLVGEIAEGVAVLTEEPRYEVIASGDVVIDGMNSLVDFYKKVKYGAYSASNKYTFKLTTDVDLSGNWKEFNEITLKGGWTFDGQCHKITMARSDAPLFAKTENGSLVKGIYLKRDYVLSSPTVDADVVYTGMLVRENYGDVDMCFFEQPYFNLVTKTNVKTVSGIIAGINYGSITNSAIFHPKASLQYESSSGIAHAYGGICGENHSVIRDCYIAGDQYSTMITVLNSSCKSSVIAYVTNDIGEGTNVSNVIATSINSSIPEGTTITIKDAEKYEFSYEDPDNHNYDSFLTGNVQYGDLDFIGSVTYHSAWKYSTGETGSYGGYPIPTGTIDQVELDKNIAPGTILLKAEDLGKLGRQIKYGKLDANGVYNFKLTEDAVLYNPNVVLMEGSSEEIGERIEWGSVNPLVLSKDWTFDGQGHTITFSGNIDAFCDSIASGASLKNLYVVGETGNMSWYKRGAIGCSGFVRVNAGEVSNCAIGYTLKIDNSRERPFSTNAGGIVGTNLHGANVHNCIASGQKIRIVNSNENSTTYANLGGWIGVNNGIIDSEHPTPGTFSEGYSYSVYFEGDDINESFLSQYSISYIVPDGAPGSGFNGIHVYGIANEGEEVSQEGLTYYSPANLQAGTKESANPEDEQFITKFEDPTEWTYCFDERKRNFYGIPMPVMDDIEIKKEEVEEETVIQVAIKTESNMLTVAELIANNPKMYDGAIITLDKDIECEGILKEGEKLENIDVDKVLETWTAIGSDQNPFTGTFDGEGHVISNLAILTNGSAFFGTIGEEGEVKNLTIENAVYAAEEYSAVEDDTKKEEDGYTTRWIGVLAKTNLGKLEDCLFVGDLVLPEGVDTTGIKWCLVAENDGYDKEGNKVEGEMNRCLGYFTNIDKVINDGSTKRQIIVSQNIGAGRNGGKKTKTATNGKKLKPNKTLEVNVDESFSDREIKSSYRQYTDEEMAAGEPAYWMNWNADGYTGEYKPIWKKGVAYPVKATVKNNAAVDPIVKVVYEIDGLTATEAKDANVSGDHFANVGSQLVVAYDRMPNKITVTGDGKEVNVTPGVSSATVSALPMGYVLEGSDDTKSFIVKVKLSYTSSATDVEPVDQKNGVVISASGRTLTVSNAEGSELSVVDILGRAVVNQTVDSDNLSIIIPSAGVYVVRAGETTKKIVVR